MLLRISFALAILVLFSSCRKEEKAQSGSDSSFVAGSAPTRNVSVDEELKIPSVPELARVRKVDSSITAAQSLPESDTIDVRSAIPAKTLAAGETVVRGIELFVVGVERIDSMTVIHGVLQNLYGEKTAVHPQPIKVTLSRDGLRKAKLLDDLTGKTHFANQTLVKGVTDVFRGGWVMLGPAGTKDVVLVFDKFPAGSPSATLIIPGFATVSGIPLTGR